MKLNRFDELIYENLKDLQVKYNDKFILKSCKWIQFFKDYKIFQSNINKSLLNNEMYSEKYNDKKIEEFSEFWKLYSKYFSVKDRRYINKSFVLPKTLLEELKTSNEYKFTPIKNKLCYCLHHSLPYQSDGYATRSKYMAEALAKCFDISVITDIGFPWNNQKCMKNVKTVPMQDIINGVTYNRQKKSFKALTLKGRYINMINSWKKMFLKEKPEYVIAASNYASAFPALIAAKSLGIPFYYEVRGLWEVTKISKNESYSNTLWYLFERYFETKVCQLSDGVFTLTTPMKQELIERGVNKNNIFLAPNCADISLFNSTSKNVELMKKLKISENDTVIGYVGTIQMYEGLDDLIKACAILKKKHLKFKLLIVGGESVVDKDNHFDYLKNLAKDLDIDNEVIMPGRVPVEDVSKYYSLMDITPFGRKNLPVCDLVSPIKPLEAMAMKKTVIVSNLRALAEIVQDNVTGLHFEKGDVESYAKVLEKAILDKDLRLKLGENAYDWVLKNRQWSSNANCIKSTISK